LGIFFIISSILGIKGAFNINSLIIFGIVLGKYYAMAWYLFWCIYGIAVGVGFIAHKYLFWQLAMVQQAIFVASGAISAVAASDAKLSFMINNAIEPSAYRGFLTFFTVIGVILLLLVLGQKKAFIK